MPVDAFEGGTPVPPAGFGPVKAHLSSGREDHEAGSREPAETKGGGKVPPIPSGRILSKVPLAEQFRSRLAEGPRKGKKGR